MSKFTGESGSRGPWLFGLIAAAALVAIVYGTVVRSTMLVTTLRYVPAESQLVVMTGSLSQLWPSIDEHFGAVLRDDSQQGPLAASVAALRDTLQEHGVPIHSLDDLSARGIDIHSGAILAVEQVSPLAGAPKFVLIVRTASNPEFLETVAKVMEATISIPPDKEGRLPIATFKSKQSPVYAAVPEAGSVVLGNDREFLRRAVARTNQNLASFRSDDEFYRELREYRGWRPFSGPDVFLFCRPLNAGPVRTFSALLRFSADDIALHADINLETAVVRSVDELFLSGAGDMTWPRYLTRESAAVFAFEHPNASRYLPLLATEFNLRKVAPSWDTVSTLLSNVQDLHQLVLAVPRDRGGVPDLQLGIWASPASLTRLLGGLRQTLQDERDRAVLNAAATQYCAAQEIPAPSCSPRVDELVSTGWLDPETRSRFLHFSIVGGLARPPAAESTEEVPLEPDALTYLVSPLNGNDRRYRPDLAKAEKAALSSDRFRFPYLFNQGVLWIATGPGDLTAFKAEYPTDPAAKLSGSPAFLASTSHWKSRSRAWGYLNIDRLPAIARNESSAKDSEDSASAFLDLRSHAAFSLELSPLPDGHRLRLDARLLKWTALRAQ